MTKFAAIEAIVCDLDGTLVDSAEDLRAALNVMLNELGLRRIAANEINSMIGDGVAKLVEGALDAAGSDLAQKDILVPCFLAIYQANAAVLTRCYPGVIETLESLRKQHFRLAVATNKPVFATKNILRALSLEEFFSIVIGGDSLPRRKPDPAALLEVARQFKLNPSQVLMVGDNVHDVEAARAAGMPCVVVSYGYHHRPPSEFHADHIIDRFDELLPLVVNPTSILGGLSTDAEVASSNRTLFTTGARL